MTDAATRAHLGQRRPGLLPLWVGVLTAPFAWVVQFFFAYLLTSIHCVNGFGGQRVITHLITLAALLLTAGAGWGAFGAWRTTGLGMQTDEGYAPGRSAFMALAGMGLSALFFLLIIYTDVGVFVLPACGT